MLTIEHIAEVLKSAVVPYDVRAVYLFGSFARGEAGPQSDVDVRLECDLEIDYADLLDIQESLGGTWAVLSRWWPTPLSSHLLPPTKPHLLTLSNMLLPGD